LQRLDGYRWQGFAVDATGNDDLWRVDGERIGPHGLVQVLQLQIADVPRQLADRAAHDVMDGFGYQNAARLGVLLQPRGDIHAVAVDVDVGDDDVAEVDRDPQRDRRVQLIGVGCAEGIVA
jgi:hypothetical protein